MEPGLLEFAANAGVSVLLTVVVISWYRSDTQRRVEEAKAREQQAHQLASQEREDKLLLLNVMGENTRAITELTQAILQLRRELAEDRKRCRNDKSQVYGTAQES